VKSWLTKNLIILTLVSLAQDAASELIYPLLPLLIAGAVASAPLAIGVIEGVAEFIAGFTKLYAGTLSDRVGRKPFVTGGYSITGIGKVFTVLSISWTGIFIGRALDRFGKGLRSTPRDALINDSVQKENLAKAFGFHRAGDNLGAVVGPLFALLLLSIFNDDVRAVAKWALIPALLSAILTIFVKEIRTKSLPKSFTKIKIPKNLKYLIATLTLIQLTNIPDALLLLRLHETGFSTKKVVLCYALYMFVAMSFAYPAGKLADQYGPKIMYSFGLIAFSISYFTLGISNSHFLAVVAISIYGIFPALTDGVGKAWIARLSSDETRGYAQGLFQSNMNFAVLAAGIWSGLIWSSGIIEIALIIAGIGALLGVLVLNLLSGKFNATNF